jgi:hypothetical protein
VTISEIRKFAAIEHLDTRVVLPVEGGGAWGVGLCFVRRRIEPQAQVEGGQALAAVKRYRGQRGPQKAPVKQDIKLLGGR